MLQSFTPPLRACVFGASGAIGAALVAALAADPAIREVWAGSRTPLPPRPKVTPFAFAFEDEAGLQSIAAQGPFELVVVATGELREPEKSWRQQRAEAFTRAFAVNTIGPATVARHLLDALPRDRRAVFAVLSAKVGSIADNRLGGWHAYRASKAALNMLVRNWAIELARTRPLGVVAALHPGTVASALSAPFRSAEQAVTPAAAAANLLSVVDGLMPADSGGLFSWDGTRLPY